MTFFFDQPSAEGRTFCWMEHKFAQCAFAMCTVQCTFAMCNVLLHNVQQTTAILPHSSCVCQPASWHYHQSKAFLDLVGGAAGSYCAGPIFFPQKNVGQNGKIGRQLGLQCVHQSDKNSVNFSGPISDRALSNCTQKGNHNIETSEK